MNINLEKAVVAFYLKAKETTTEGQIINSEEMNELNNKISNILPKWFIELFSTYPLSGAQIDYRQYEPEDEYDGYVDFKIASPQDIYNETQECYPGIAIKELGYFCFGIDPTGSGDQYFTTSKEGDNPPVFQVYHDVSDIGVEIERNGMTKIATSLSEFFLKARASK